MRVTATPLDSRPQSREERRVPPGNQNAWTRFVEVSQRADHQTIDEDIPPMYDDGCRERSRFDRSFRKELLQLLDETRVEEREGPRPGRSLEEEDLKQDFQSLIWQANCSQVLKKDVDGALGEAKSKPEGTAWIGQQSPHVLENEKSKMWPT